MMSLTVIAAVFNDQLRERPCAVPTLLSTHSELSWYRRVLVTCPTNEAAELL